MCYSAQAEQELKKLEKRLKAVVDYEHFEQVFEQRLLNEQIMIPKAMEANFYQPDNAAGKRIKKLIDEYHNQRTKELEADLFRQKKRLADATRKLALKETKKATEDKRIAGNKVKWHLKKIEDLKRTKLEDKDSRIYPKWYAPVIVMEDGKRVIRPMRYHCFPQGKPAEFLEELKGLYNARRDNLEKFWKGQFGHTHAIMVMSSFYENVDLHDYEHREKGPDEKKSSVTLHFNPQPKIDMLVACLWSRWQKKGEPDLYSIAAITDEPPPEIAATGHERCVIPLNPKNINQWLQPEGASKDGLYGIMDDREKPLYEHRLVA